MPVFRYFSFVGGALLVLLFLVDAYLPKLPIAERSTAAADLSVIRIHTAQKWPERVVFDTTLPTITPPKNAMTDLRIRQPMPIADGSSKARLHEAFAQASTNQPTDPRKTELRRKRRSVARAHTPQPTLLVAQQPRFGLFGNGIW
jgi:hypothetical protein